MPDDQQLLLEIRDTVIRLDERQKAINTKVNKIEGAVFGNGVPGMRAELSNLGERVGKIEEFESSCPILALQEDLQAIRLRHQGEDKQEDDTKKDMLSKVSEYRKFKWGLVALVIATLLNILLNYLKII